MTTPLKTSVMPCALESLEPRALLSSTGYDALEQPGMAPPAGAPDNAVVVDADLEWGRFDIGAGGHVDQVIVHPTVPGLMYARSDVGGVFRRDPGSDRWHQLLDQLGDEVDANGEQNLIGADAIAVSATDPDVVFMALGRLTDLGGPGGLYRSGDRGLTWTEVLDVEVGSNMLERQRSGSIAVDPINGDYVYFGSRENGLYVSTDGGFQWTQVSLADVPVGINIDNSQAGRDIGIRSVIIDPNNTMGSGASQRASDIYVVPRNEGIHHSSDGGVTWNKLTGPNAPDHIESWAFDDTGRYLYISGEYQDPADPNKTLAADKVLV